MTHEFVVVPKTFRPGTIVEVQADGNHKVVGSTPELVERLMREQAEPYNSIKPTDAVTDALLREIAALKESRDYWKREFEAIMNGYHELSDDFNKLRNAVREALDAGE